MKYITLALSSLFLLTAVPATAQTVSDDITVKVYGLVCDFCAQAIEKVFMKQEAVEGITVDLDNFLVTIDLKDGQTIDDDTVTRLITDSGYTVNEIIREDT